MNFTRSPVLRDPSGLLFYCFACLFLATFLCPSPADCACECGFSDGVFTTDVAITIDGDMSDWTTSGVLADLDNSSCDGGDDGVPIDPQPDLDAPIQSTGRDLLQFSMTWDDTYIYTYTSRAASGTNVQRFIYYADENNDEILDFNEHVIVVEWKGSNRDVSFNMGRYVPAAGAAGPGDPLVDSLAKADGYMLPGTLAKKSLINYPLSSGSYGSADGLSMEWRISWAELGLAPGTAFTFHISSTNSQPGSASFPDQVDDNMGGCGGGIGRIQNFGMQWNPDVTVYGVPGQTAYAAHSLTNTSNGADTFNLTWANTPAFTPTVSYFQDTNGDGVPSPGDILLTDTDGDGNPDTGEMAAGSLMTVFALFDIPATATGTSDITSTATSSRQPALFDTVMDGVSASTDSVVLAGFKADRRKGGVLVQWETVSEVNTAGFHLWRSETENGPYQGITRDLIIARGGIPGGGAYSWLDDKAGAESSFYYKLEQLHIDGSSLFHGPVVAQGPSSPQAALQVGAQPAPASPALLPQDEGSCFVEAAGF